MNLQPTFSLVAVVRDPNDYDGMEGGGQMTTVHALCEKTDPNGVSSLFVLNELNSRSVLDGTLSETWRKDIAKAGIDPVFAIGAAQTLASVLNGNAKLNELPAIADVMADRFPDRQMPYLRTPSVSMHLA